MTATPRHSVSVAAAIFDESGENVLLIKRRDNGNWEPPGGVLELDETIEEGLRREVREETAAEIEVVRLSGVYKNMPRGIVALVFSCSITASPSVSSAEAEAVRWIPIGEVSTLMDAAYAVRILDARSQGSPRIRSHDGTEMLDSRSIDTNGTSREGTD